MDTIEFARPFLSDAEVAAAADAVRSGWITGGPRLAEFEKRVAERCGVSHAIGVSSWTTGAFLVLHAWGIGPGDEVIVPSLTFIASVNVIRHAGARPVFAEVDPRTFNIDPGDIEHRITSRTKAIIAVDQLGLPCDIDAIDAVARRHGLRLLDDAACAFGSFNRARPVGSLAEVTVFSLHARKVITTGEGGMIVTDDGVLAERLRRLRHQGMSLSDYARHGAAPTIFEEYPEVGYNCRITDIQAAIGLAQLERLDEALAKRRAIAAAYTAALADHPFIEPPYIPAGFEPNWQSYQVSLREDAPLGRNQLMDELWSVGVPTRRGVMASHLEQAYADARVHLPKTEKVAAGTLQLPMHPNLTGQQQSRILEALREITACAVAR